MIVKLKDIGKIITGNTPSKKEESYWSSNDICFVKPDLISENGISIIEDSNEYISEAARSKARVVSKDTVFITCIGSIGKVGIAGEGDYAFNQQINAIVPNDRIEPRYLAYALLRAKSRLDDIANAPVVPIINKSQFGEFSINIEEDRIVQSEIVLILDKLGKIIKKREEELKILDDLIKARFVEMFGDPVSNPRRWGKKMLVDVCIKLNDGTHFSPNSFETGEYKYITAKNIKPWGFDFSNITYVPESVHRPIYERCNPEKGDVLYIKDGVTTGIAMVNTLDEEFTLLSSVALLKQDRELMNGHFLCGVLNNDEMYSDIRRNMGGAAITRLTIAKLNGIMVIVPPIGIQETYAAFVAQVDKSKAAVRKSLDENQKLFDSLMQQYFA